MMKIAPNRGLIRFILLIIVAIILLSYFGFDLRNTVEDEQTQSNFSYVWNFVRQVWDFVVDIWDSYLSDPLSFIWDRWLAPLFETIRNRGPEDLIGDTPAIE